MIQRNYIEDPSSRSPSDNGVMCSTTGKHADSIYVEVYVDTYIRPQFQEWINSSILTRLNPGGSLRIAVVPRPEDVGN